VWFKVIFSTLPFECLICAFTGCNIKKITFLLFTESLRSALFWNITQHPVVVVHNYHMTPHDIPEERISCQNCSGSLQSRLLHFTLTMLTSVG
jgi:hypothetical protein